MKLLADRLRQLRRLAGEPSYRKLGKLVHVQQHTLSQIANGNRVSWARVLLYVQALRAYQPAAVSDDDLTALKTLYDGGDHRHQMISEDGARHRERTIFWEEVDAVTALSARPAAAAHVHYRWETTAGITDAGQLTATETLHDLHRLLYDVALRHGIDIADPARRLPRPQLFSWFGTPGITTPIPETPPIRHPDNLTLGLLLHLIRLCGGTAGDCHTWQITWERLHTPPAEPSDRPPPDSPLIRNLPAETARLPGRLWPGSFLRRPAAASAAG